LNLIKKFKSADHWLDLYLMFISIGLNAYSFFGIMTFESVLPKIFIASFGASLVLLQVNVLRKWKVTKKGSLLITYSICTFFSLLSTCYLITSLTLGKTVERNSTLDVISRQIDDLLADKERLIVSNDAITTTNNLLTSSINDIKDDKSFYGDNFYTLKKQATAQIADKEQNILLNIEAQKENNLEIQNIAAKISKLRSDKALLVSSGESDGFEKLANALNIPYEILLVVSFFLLASVLELGIFILTPALGEFSEKEEHRLVEDLLNKLEVTELELKALEKTSTTVQRPTIDKYIDALFSTGTKKLAKKEDVARITGYNANVCDDFHIKLTNKFGSKKVPFIQTERGRGTFSVYTREEIKNEISIKPQKVRA